MNRLNGKRALITGGTTGIGLETARQFVAEGARVAVTGSNPDTLEQARRELGDVARDIRRRGVERFGGAREAVFLNDGNEDLEGTQSVHDTPFNSQKLNES